MLCRLWWHQRGRLDTAQGPSLGSRRVKWSKVEGEEEERNQPSSVPCWTTAVHACLWSWTDVPSVDGCSLEALLLLSYSPLLLGRTAWGKKLLLLGKAGRSAYTEFTRVLVLPHVSYPSVYQQSCGGSSHHLMSNEGHLGWATFSPMTPGAGRGYVWQQSVPAQDNQKGVWACSILVLKKDKWQCSLNWLSAYIDFLEMRPLYIQLFLWHRGEEGSRGRQTSKKTFWSPFCRWLHFALTAGWFWWFSMCFLSCDTVILHDHGWCSLLLPTWSLQLLSCSVTQEAECLCQNSCSIWDLTPKKEEFYSPGQQACVNLGVPGRNILGLSFIRTVNYVSSEWWVVIVSCIQILISQENGYNQ